MNVSPQTKKLIALLGGEEPEAPLPPGPVFLIGAGFSRAISSAMPLLKDLSQAVGERYTGAGSLPDDIAKMLQSNIEEALSYLVMPKPWIRESVHLYHRSIYLDLSHVVAGVIAEREEQVMAEVHMDVPDWITALLRYWHFNRCTVLTLNYDCLIERFAREFLPDPKKHDFAPCAPWRLYPGYLTNAIARNGGIWNSHPHPTFRLLKLHGSTNWFYSGRESSRGETIYYTTPSGPVSFWKKNNVGDQMDREAVADKFPLVVPPVFDKSTLLTHESLQGMWFSASQALRSARHVYIIGYSMPPSDRAMLHFLLDSVFPGSAVEVVSDNPDMFERFRGNLPVAGEAVTQRFFGQNAVADFVRALPIPPPSASV